MDSDRPNVVEHDAITHETTVRPMTDDEYAQIIADGWTPGEEAQPE